jgi:hypothetical protein
MGDTVELLVSELVTNAINATGITDDDPADSRLIGNVKPIYVCPSGARPCGSRCGTPAAADLHYRLENRPVPQDDGR